MKSLHARTLADTCAEATKRGYQFITPPLVGATQTLDEFMDELDKPNSTAKEYAIFGNLIIHLPDAWCEDAEIYELAY